MYIRKLQEKDAPFMLEWMHDEDVICYLSNNFAEKKLEDCLAFIKASSEDGETINRAICNDADEYLGTVSIKQMDPVHKHGEYAIAMRSCAIGTGASAVGTREILKVAFEEFGLQRVFLNVIPDNVRANRFYQKMGFRMEGTFKEHLYLKGRFWDLNWYAMTRAEYEAGK